MARFFAVLLVVLAAAVSVLNGLPSSPLFDTSLYNLGPVSPDALEYFHQGEVLFHLNTVFIAVLTFLLAGIPAAIYERMRGERARIWLSHAIWLMCAALLAIPGILGSIGYFEVL
ncbi:MAG: hypothetical protein ACK5JT_04420 [Hyphomicrobiaceae bacterium]